MTSIPAALRDLALADPEAASITDVHGTITRRDFENQATALARLYLDRGVQVGDLVSIGLPSDASFLDCLARDVDRRGDSAAGCRRTCRAPSWTPCSSWRSRRSAIGFDGGALAPSMLTLPEPTGEWRDPLPDVTSPNLKAPMSGGSTGRPKLIVATNPAEVDGLALLGAVMRIQPEDTSPDHRADAPQRPVPHLDRVAWRSAVTSMLPGRFDAETTLRLIEQHRVGWVYLVPTMMSRISKLPDEVRDRTTSAACTP